MNQIKYEIAKATIKKMFKAGLITRDEFVRIDAQNRRIILNSAT